MTKEIVNEIARLSLDLDFVIGEPPEKIIRSTLKSLLISIADVLDRYDGSYNYGDRDNPYYMLFDMSFPMTLTFSSATLSWSTRLEVKLENNLSDNEDA